MTYHSQIRAGDYLRLSAQRFGDKPCFVAPNGSTRTFAETNTRVNKLADSLARRGVDKGDRVAILDVDSAEYYEALLACLKLGAVYVPLNNKLAAEEVHTLLRRAAPKVIFVGRRYLAMGHLVQDRLSIRPLLVSLDGSADLDVTHLISEGGDLEPAVAVADGDVIGLAFTSGTTGLPKGVLQSQGMVKSLILLEAIEYDSREDDFRYTASPAFHIAGQAIVFMHIARGIPTLIQPQFDAATTLHWLQNGGITACFLVPTMIRRVLDEPGVRDSSYDDLRLIIYGGAPMTPDLLREAMDVFGCDFINAFGAGTEAGLQTLLTTADHRRASQGASHLLGSIGKPPIGVDLRIVRPDGSDVDEGEVGEIVTRSDTVMSGYLEMPEETINALREGWFWGGDLARRDEEGYLYLAGRSKDMIIRGGENVYPVEIETVLADHPDVAHVAVVGHPDELWGEVIVAYVAAAEGHAIDADELRTHCRGKLASYKVPVSIEILPELPMNSSGKILKRELRARGRQ